MSSACTKRTACGEHEAVFAWFESQSPRLAVAGYHSIHDPELVATHPCALNTLGRARTVERRAKSWENIIVVSRIITDDAREGPVAIDSPNASRVDFFAAGRDIDSTVAGE